MDLTIELKDRIDRLSYESLLTRWRHAPIGHPWFQGESGEYIARRISILRADLEQDELVETSKRVGW